MNPLDRIAEQRIEDAIAAGELDDVPGKGKPLQLEDLSLVPEELRGGYRLLKGAGFLPEEMQVKRECLRLGDLIAACENEAEARDLRDRRARLLLRYEVLMQRRAERGER